MTNHAEYAKRYHERITAEHSIATHTDPNLSPAGLAQWQREKVEQWRASAAQITPAVPTVPARSTVLDSLKPTGSDDIALHAREREKVATLLATGRTIDEIIAGADRARLAAVFDGLETSDDVLASRHGDEIVAERTGAIFDRLAEVDPAAKKVADAEAAAAPALAWKAIFADLTEHGVATVESKSALFAVDPLAYELVADAEREVDVRAIDRLQRSVA